MIIPQYLEKISKIIGKSKHSVTLKLECLCGFSQFKVLRNKPIKADQITREQWEKLINGRFDSGNVEQYSDPDGDRYIVKKNFFGKIIDKVKLNDMPTYFETNIVKVVCNHCGKEYIIFDNREFGYDAFIERKKDISYDGVLFENKKIKKLNDDVLEIEIKIFNDLSYDEFCNQISRETTIKEYSNAFSAITIYGKVIDSNYKRVIIFSEETA